MKQCFCQLIKLDAPNSLCSASELFFRLHFRVLTPKTFVMSEPQAQDLAFPFEEQAKENGGTILGCVDVDENPRV